VSRLSFERWRMTSQLWQVCPYLAVFDRPKTIALAWAKVGKVTEWNPICGAVALDLGIGVELCWPRSPELKRSVENLVGWVKGSFFIQRVYVVDVTRHLVEWDEEVNPKRPSRATRTIPLVRLAEEKPRLRPLSIAPADLALRIPVHVGPTGHVCHDTHPYSMDPDATGSPAR